MGKADGGWYEQHACIKVLLCGCLVQEGAAKPSGGEGKSNQPRLSSRQAWQMKF